MRMLFPWLSVVAASCNQMALEEQALVNHVEQNVVLPAGGGNLQCYERHYAVLSGEELKRYFKGVAAPPERVVIGRYLHGPGRRPGVYMARNEDGLPAIGDAGCSMLELFYAPGDTDPDALKASCSPDIGGGAPDDVVNPPVTC
jgi:hypothetical protein